MVADCGATCAKYLLCLFNFVFFVSIHTTYCCLFIYKDIYLYIKEDLVFYPKRMQKNCPILDNCNGLFSAKFSVAYLDCDGRMNVFL